MWENPREKGKIVEEKILEGLSKLAKGATEAFADKQDDKFMAGFAMGASIAMSAAISITMDGTVEDAFVAFKMLMDKMGEAHKPRP